MRLGPGRRGSVTVAGVSLGGGIVPNGLHTVQGISRGFRSLAGAEAGESARSDAECATGRAQAGAGRCHGVERVPAAVRRAFTTESLREGGVSFSVTGCGCWGREGELAGAAGGQ